MFYVVMEGILLINVTYICKMICKTLFCLSSYYLQYKEISLENNKNYLSLLFNIIASNLMKIAYTGFNALFDEQ